MPGSTRVWNSPSTSPPRTFTAPISVIALSVGEPPVVSRSTTTKVTADRGVPSSSIVACSYRVAGDGAAEPARGPGSTPGEEGTGRTVGRGADSPGDARRGSYDPRRVSQRRDEGPPAGPPGRVPRPHLAEEELPGHEGGAGGPAQPQVAEVVECFRAPGGALPVAAGRRACRPSRWPRWP